MRLNYPPKPWRGNSLQMALSERHAHYPDEIEARLRRLRAYLPRHGLDGAMFWYRANFAWITGGRDNHIVGASPVGEAAIIVTEEKIFCLCSAIESPRMRIEELAGTEIEAFDFPWHDSHVARARFIELTKNARIACDVDKLNFGLPTLPADFVKLRYVLDEAETRRYRDGCVRATRAMEQVCTEITPGMTECEIAGILEHFLRSAGLKPHVTLVGCDERITNFRHPIPTQNRLERLAMVVTCAEYHGLIANLTRFVHFDGPPRELIERHQKVCDIDACAITATRPGRTLGEVFTDIRRAYDAAGFPDDWQSHHQGGLTGYATRELVATAESEFRIEPNQAYAWNPSLPGVKSEDTILSTSDGAEVLTAPSITWPMIAGRHARGTLPRPGILIR